MTVETVLPVFSSFFDFNFNSELTITLQKILSGYGI